MGVVNTTPDSFSDGGKYLSPQKAVQHAQKMVSEGADIIDIGGCSSRPGSLPPTPEVEIKRTVPIIKELTPLLSTPISIDSYRLSVITAAINAGASIVNDITAGSNPGTLQVVAAKGVRLILMHMQGEPQTMQKNPAYKDVIDDLKAFFETRLQLCERAGIKPAKIILDPGIGFGKTLDHNLAILKRLGEFKQSFGLPLLVGISRKSMIGALLEGRPVEGRLIGSVLASIIAFENGADILRIHDVQATKDAFNIREALL